MNENDVRIVRITNISNFDFTGELGARYGGRDFFVPAGGSLLTPFTVGDHLATHLARQILIKQSPIRDSKETDGRGSDRALWDDQIIDEIKKKIITDVYEEERKPILSDSDRLAAKVEELNRVTAPDAGGNADASGIQPSETVDATSYKDKSEIIAELNKRGIKFDARSNKANLEGLLK
jgi:hypothetical protein